MSNRRSSFLKTAMASAAIVLISLAVLDSIAHLRLHIPTPLSSLTLIALSLPFISAVVVFGFAAAGGLVALRRDAFESAGRPYADPSPRESPILSRAWRIALSPWRSITSRRTGILAAHLRPGDCVRIRSLPEILATLDERGTLNGVPFIPEMAVFCGKRARVFRRVDKLNDWIHATGLKRMRRLVLLHGIRCDGSSHGGCQANCHLRWSEDWLTLSGPPLRNSPDGECRSSETRGLEMTRLPRKRTDDSGVERYVCQATELTAGGRSVAWADPRHYLRDLVVGNIRLKLFLLGISLSSFNWIQRLRGGTVSPYYAVGHSSASPTESLGLAAGDLVRVKSKAQIERTLNNRSRNRGLWFDGEMLRFCGGSYRVKARVERLIVERTGELKSLSSPCIILEGVTASGELHGFNPENEHVFWREIWLERVPAGE